MRTWLIGVLSAFGVGLLVGLGIGFRHTAPAAPAMVEHPEVRLPSGAVVLHHNPKVPAPSIGPLPRGYKVRTVARVDIAPPAVQSGAIPVQSLTVAQVDTPEGARVVVKDDGGRIVGGAAWDVGPPAPEYHWSLQAVRDLDTNGRGSWGAELAHYRGHLVISVAVTGSRIQAGMGWRW